MLPNKRSHEPSLFSFFFRLVPHINHTWDITQSRKQSRAESFSFVRLQPHVEVALQTNNDTVIRSVTLFAEGIFDGESLV